MKKYLLVVDPTPDIHLSHAWLGVPVAELVEIGIAGNISRCSYAYQGMAWLEEDVDMSVYLEALAERRGHGHSTMIKFIQDWLKYNVVEVTEENTHIRSLPAFSAEVAA